MVQPKTAVCPIHMRHFTSESCRCWSRLYTQSARTGDMPRPALRSSSAIITRSTQNPHQLSPNSSSNLRLVVECSFVELCSNKEMRSLAKQLEYTMSICRRSSISVELTFAAFTGQLAAHAAVMGCHGWDAQMTAQMTLELFDPAELVVLSPDAEEPLQEVSSSKVYCIGGIVDRAIIKGVTHSFASSHGLQCARLPIREHASALGMQPRSNKNPVLNVNDVAAALLGFKGSGDWVQALHAAVPQRKRQGQVDGRRKKPRACNLQHLYSCIGGSSGASSSAG